MKELAKRVSVALWGVPLLLFLTYMGGYYFAAFVLVVNSMALWEFYTMFRHKEIYALRTGGVALSALFLIVAFFYPALWAPAALAVFTILLLGHLKVQKGLASANTALTIAGFAYITLLLHMLLQLRENFAVWMPEAAGTGPQPGGWLIIILLAAIWICDTAAYFGGRQFGKHKLAPQISPNKTIEGALFGLIFGVLTFWGLSKWWLPALPDGYSLLCGALVGVFGQLGDLVESRFKRDAGVKDTSALLPGHGGILDRFDSLIFVSPFLWFLFKYQLL